MKIKKIALIQPTFSRYNVQQHFTFHLQAAFQKLGIETDLLDVNDPIDFCQRLKQNPPDFTFCFNGLLPDKNGNLLYDFTNIPHVSYLIDSQASYFLHLTHSPYSILTCIDHSSVDFFNGLGFEQTLFTPHAIESSLHAEAAAIRPYDVVMLGSCIDYEEIRNSWRQKFPPMLCLDMEDAAELILTDPTIPSHIALTKVLNQQLQGQMGFDPQALDLVTMLDEIEMFARGKDRLALIKAIKSSQVHIFGEGPWKKVLGEQPNVTIHAPVPFIEALEIMKKSKIVLNSCPWIKNGAHERIFSAMACGALVITNKNVYLPNQFEDEKAIVYYQPPHMNTIDEQVKSYLDNEQKRQSLVLQSQKIVKHAHTWDQRAAQLLEELPPLIIRSMTGSYDK